MSMIEYIRKHDERIHNKYAHVVLARVKEEDITDNSVLRWLSEQPYELSDPINYHLLVIITKYQVAIFDLNNLKEVGE